MIPALAVFFVAKRVKENDIFPGIVQFNGMEHKKPQSKNEELRLPTAMQELKQRLLLLGYGLTFVIDLIYAIELIGIANTHQSFDVVAFAGIILTNYAAKRTFPMFVDTFHRS
jgi:hypothetical protein